MKYLASRQFIWEIQVKGKRELKTRTYWGNHFWSRGYCVTTVGLDEDKIRRYVKYQEENEQREDNESREYGLF